MERLRRRARGRNNETVEIHVQEVPPYEYLAGLEASSRNRMFAVAEFFEDIMWEALRCPPTVTLAEDRATNSAVGHVKPTEWFC